MDSSGGSLDSHMLSISSEDTDSIGNSDLEDPLTSIISEISHHIFVEYKASKGFRLRPQWAHAGNCEAGDSPGNSDNKSKSCATSQPHGSEVPRSGKRGRPVQDDEDWDGGFRRPPRPTKRAAVSPNRPRTRALACPFWKLEPQAHGKCFPRKFSRISDVKLHLRRKHKQPASDYCQRCWAAFESKAHKTAHLSDESGLRCKYDPAARPPGIDNNMDVALSRKSKRDQSVEDRWFAIWDIVFPDQPRPSSPYIDDSLTEDATQLQELIVNRWPSIIASILDEAGGSVASTDIDRLEREHLIRATLTRLSDDFSAEQAQIRTTRSASGHQSLGGQTSSSSARADSAIEMGSYQSNRRLPVGSSDEASRSMPGPAISQLETHSPARNQISVMQNRRERPILPLGQNSFNVNYDQQQTPMPPPTTNSRAMLPDLPETSDVYGAGHSFGSEFTIDDPFPPPAENYTPRSFLGTGGYDANASLESTEVLTEFDW